MCSKSPSGAGMCMLVSCRKLGCAGLGKERRRRERTGAVYRKEIPTTSNPTAATQPPSLKLAPVIRTGLE